MLSLKQHLGTSLYHNMVLWSGYQSGLEKKLKHLANNSQKEQSHMSCAIVHWKYLQ